MPADFPFDAILFDCDGVLVDSEPIVNRVLAAMLTELGWPLTAEQSMRIFTGKTVRDEAPRILAETGFAITPEWLADFWQRRNEMLAQELVEIPGAPEAVRALDARLNGRVAVASGADRRKIELQLDKVGLLPLLVDRICSGQEQPRNKPHPDVYLAAAALLGVDPRRCAVVEDTTTGTAAGVAAGATVFGYSPGGPGHSTAEALLAAGATRVFARMDELHALLEAHRLAA